MHAREISFLWGLSILIINQARSGVFYRFACCLCSQAITHSFCFRWNVFVQEHFYITIANSTCVMNVWHIHVKWYSCYFYIRDVGFIHFMITHCQTSNKWLKRKKKNLQTKNWCFIILTMLTPINRIHSSEGQKVSLVTRKWAKEPNSINSSKDLQGFVWLGFPNFAIF